MVATKRLRWNGEQWDALEDWRFSWPESYVLFSWPDAPPYLAEVVFCKVLVHEDDAGGTWVFEHTQTNY